MSASTSAATGRVLVVEEDPIDRARIETLLKEAGYAVDSAIDELHAAELAELRDYGLVIASSLAACPADRLAGVPIVEVEDHTDILAAVAQHLAMSERQEPLLIDLDRLDSLRAETGAELFPKLLGHYLDAGRERLARMAGLLDQAALATLAREAHNLKGLCATFGAPRLREEAAAVEKAAKSDDLDAVSAALPRLQALAEDTWLCFERELSQTERANRE